MGLKGEKDDSITCLLVNCLFGIRLNVAHLWVLFTVMIITEEHVLIFKMEVCLTLEKGDTGDGQETCDN